jgi:hypothetical protein
MARALGEAARLVRPGGVLVADHDPQRSAYEFRGVGRALERAIAALPLAESRRTFSRRRRTDLGPCYRTTPRTGGRPHAGDGDRHTATPGFRGPTLPAQSPGWGGGLRQQDRARPL